MQMNYELLIMNYYSLRGKRHCERGAAVSWDSY